MEKCQRCVFNCRCCYYCFSDESDIHSTCRNCYDGNKFKPICEEFVNRCPFKDQEEK